MKAVVYSKYGSPDVLRIAEVEKPAPAAKEVLIKVHATSVTTGDVNVRGFTFIPRGFTILARLVLGVTKPKKQILGVEFSGVIEAVGKDVKAFKAGDQVYGIDGFGMGAYAEYKCIGEGKAIVLKPAKISFEQAASIPNGACTALHFLRKLGNIQPGHKVLVNGASGSVGIAGVQLAKSFGAEVYGVCSGANTELVKSHGAARVFDYSNEDFTQSGETFDLILDTVGNIAVSSGKKALRENGKLLLVAAGISEFGQMLWTSIVGGKKVVAGGGMESEMKENLELFNELIESGKLVPVIDRSYALEQIVEAHRYVDSGRKKGNVVITI